jgi:Flp pilus assembly protein TadG
MWAIKPHRASCRRPRISQSGTAAIEFALLALVFFTFVFGIIEIARMLYVYNTLQEVTRRAATAAVNVYPSSETATDQVKQEAIFRNAPGNLALAPPITDKHIRLSYLRFDLSVIPTTSLPESAAKNRQICSSNPHATNCIRFVQAQVCDPAATATCTAVTSKMILPLIDLRVPLHKATTIVPVGSLGYVPGTPPPCPCS